MSLSTEEQEQEQKLEVDYLAVVGCHSGLFDGLSHLDLLVRGQELEMLSC